LADLVTESMMLNRMYPMHAARSSRALLNVEKGGFERTVDESTDAGTPVGIVVFDKLHHPTEEHTRLGTIRVAQGSDDPWRAMVLLVTLPAS